MARSNDFYNNPQEDNKPSLAENIWLIFSILFGILIVANISENASEAEAEATITIAGLIFGAIGLLIRGINKLFDYLSD